MTLFRWEPIASVRTCTVAAERWQSVRVRVVKIGEIARRTGTTPKTIRYYEDIGLIPEPDRALNGYRDYSVEAVDRLVFIRDAQATGLSLAEIGSILDLRGRGESTCDHVTELLEHHLEALDEHIARLERTREQLLELTERAQSLDPADCVDPVRCQTIAREVDGVDASVSVHAPPAAHPH